MSVALMTHAFQAAVTSTQKLVLLALCDCANDQGECYPSVPTLMTKCSLGERAVQKAINELEAAGFLRREFRTGRATVYWMAPLGDAKAVEPPHDVHPRTTCAPHDVHPPPHHVRPTPAPRAPRTIKEPLLNRHKAGDAPSARSPVPFNGMNDLEIPARAMVGLDVGWRLPDGWRADAEALGWSADRAKVEGEKFRQFFVVGKGAGTRRTLRGWRQSWSNWLGNAAKFSGGIVLKEAPKADTAAETRALLEAMKQTPEQRAASEAARQRVMSALKRA